MGIEDVRARLKDRQTKDGALGTEDVAVCLDLGLIEELERIQTDLAAAENEQSAEIGGKPRLSGSRAATPEDSPEVAELKKQLATKEQEVKDASLRLVFRSIGSTHYQEILNRNPDANEGGDAYADFLNDLAGACLYEVWDRGEPIKGLAWDEVRSELSYGEWDEATTKVLALNRRKVDIPFSLRPSKQSRS